MDTGPEDRFDLLLIEFFLFDQGILELLECMAMLFKEFESRSVGHPQIFSEFGVDDFLGPFAKLPLLVHLAPQKRIAIGKLKGNRTEFFAHAPVGDHATRQGGGPFEIVLGADTRFVVDDLFGGASCKEHDELISQFTLRHVHTVFGGEDLGASEGLSPGDNRDFMDSLCTC